MLQRPDDFRLGASVALPAKRLAAEELVAEIGAAFLCAELQITQDVRPDHAQYLAQWLKLMRSDSRAVFTAAGALVILVVLALFLLVTFLFPWLNTFLNAYDVTVEE